MSVGRFLQQGAAGNAGEAVYVEDVFSTYLYKGSQSNKTITNGIDLAGEGGLVWLKGRTNTQAHGLYDTARGVSKLLQSDSSVGQSTYSGVNQFNSNGFRIGSQAEFNQSNLDYVSWTFRKQPGFFDVVTYTGNGSTQEISHNLGATPGCVIIKSTSANSWIVWHRESYPNNQSILRLNLTNQADNGFAAQYFGNNSVTVNPTSTTLTVGQRTEVNGSSNSFVAYLFAHDAQDFGANFDESIIKCGSYAGNGSSTGPTINLGWEPQWLLIKRASAVENWVLYDTMRGITARGLNDPFLLANNSIYEQEGSFLEVNPTGFQPTSGDSSLNSSSNFYIYIAIRRPHKPASELDATDLFAVDSRVQNIPLYDSNFTVDAALQKRVSVSGGPQLSARLIDKRAISTDSSNPESTDAAGRYDVNNGVFWDPNNNVTTDATYYAWMFRRAPGFFDVVTYTGNGSAGRNIAHSLGVAPELIIIKQRDSTRSWAVYNSSSGTGKFLKLQDNAAEVTQSGVFDTAPTASVFTVETNTYVNINGGNYIAYLFATVPGISKVGTYTGNGTSDGDSQNIDCGFSTGARFVLIKSIDTINGGWQVFYSITGGNDSFFYLNNSSAQVTNEDPIDPYSGGFAVTRRTVTGNSNTNENNENYLFLAIA